MKLPRNSKHKYRVIYDRTMLEGVVANAAHDFPNETGGFLLSSPKLLGSGVWMVTGFHTAVDKKATPNRFGFGWQDYMKAVKYGARRDLVVVGMYHSHPWQRSPPLVVDQHSPDDTHVQSIFDFPLSLVIGITPEGWTMATWKNGYNAPIQASVRSGRKEYALYSWLAKNVKDELWGNHRAVLKAKQGK